VGTEPKGKHLEKRLTAATVANLKVPGFYGDGHGLYLKVDASGAKRWVQRLVIQGRRRDIGLGSASLISLADAREAALSNRKAARSGDDPIAARKRTNSIVTFKAAAEEVHRLRKPTWRNGKHAQQWLNTVKEHAYPHIGQRRIDVITSADVMAVLMPIWNSHPETARRVKQRIGTIMDWAKAKGWRSDNPVQGITTALPKHDRSKIIHRKALPYDKVQDAIISITGSGASIATKLAFELLILTATRSGETRNALWDEFDLAKATWTIPASRMKSKKEHKVPLGSRCLEILGEAQLLRTSDGPDYVFPGSVKGKPLSDMTLSKLLKELKVDAVPHGFRSSFRDWAAEQTNIPREVCEFALAHVINDKAEKAYARSDLFDKRRKLMVEWSTYISKKN
jgi:integrase